MINSKLQQTLKNHLHPEPTWNAYMHSSLDSDFKVILDFRPHKTLFPATFFDAPKCHAILAKWIKIGPRLWHTAKKRLWRSPLHEAHQPDSGPLLLHMAPPFTTSTDSTDGTWHPRPSRSAHLNPKKICQNPFGEWDSEKNSPRYGLMGSSKWNHPTATAYFGSWWTFQDPEDCQSMLAAPEMLKACTKPHSLK